MPAFQATCLEPLPRVIPPAQTRPVRVFSQDERRFGGLTVRRRRLTAFGVQPVGTVPHVFEWFDVDGAVAPTTGERFCPRTALSQHGEFPTLRGHLRAGLPRQLEPPAPGQQWHP